jgi:hypothetical protein
VATRPQERPGIPRKVIPAAFFYAQDVRYFAIEHMEKVRPGTGRETGLGHVRREAFQAGTAYKEFTL